jgi:hypothetical protein
MISLVTKRPWNATHMSDFFPPTSFATGFPFLATVRTDGDSISSSSSSPRRLFAPELVVGTAVPSIYCSCNGTRAVRRLPSATGVCSSMGAFRFPNVEGGTEGSGVGPAKAVGLLTIGVVIGLEDLIVVASGLGFEVDARGARGIVVLFMGRRRVSGSCDSSLMTTTWDGSGDRRRGRSRIGRMAGEYLRSFCYRVSVVYAIRSKPGTWYLQVNTRLLQPGEIKHKWRRLRFSWCCFLGPVRVK